MKINDLKYLIAYILPITGFLAVMGHGIWTFSAVLFAFVAVPVIESFVQRSEENLSVEEANLKTNSLFFDILLYLNIPIIYSLIFILFSNISRQEYTSIELIGMLLSTGIVIGGCGINVGHELGHKSSWMAQTSAKLLLLPALYMHFFIEHNRGHHLNVGTPLDPATSKLDEIVYTFWWRSTWGSYKHAWVLEAERLTKAQLPVFHYSNQMILFHFIQGLYLLGVFILFSWIGVLAAVLIAIIAFLLLETINYVEHYGLERKVLDNGRYERVDVFHSWNSNHEMGRLILYELTRHSDHHYKASKKYQDLNHYDSSPQLPYGYPTSMLISFVPPLWFKIMNPIVEEIKCR